MKHISRDHAGRLSRTVALGATLVLVAAGSTMAGLDRGELPDEGFAHTSLIDDNVGTLPTPDSLVDVYAWLASTQWAAGGELPPAGVTHTSVVEPSARTMPTPDSLVDVYAWLASTQWAAGGSLSGPGVDIDTSGPIVVETRYTLHAADPGYQLGWHVNHGPVIVTVTAGTLTFVDDTCQTFDLVAGQSYIEPAGEVLDARLLPEKNPDGAAVGWLTTRLSPQGVAAVEVEAPCVM
jgi:quercetin dioxygenase-like cupin family protein